MASYIELESVYKNEANKIAEIHDGIVSFGREPDNTIIVDSTAVSRRHGVLVPAAAHWIYRDLGSTNGSYVNDVQVIGGQYRLVRNGDIIRIANFMMRVKYRDSLVQEEPSLLVFYHDEFKGEYFVSEGETFDAGGDNAGIVIEGEDSSRIQFCIYFKNNHFQLQVNELKSPLIINGTLAKGLITLANGDEVTVGLYKIIVNDPGLAPELELAAEEVYEEQREEDSLLSSSPAMAKTVAEEAEEPLEQRSNLIPSLDEVEEPADLREREIRAYSQDSLPEHLAERKESLDSWHSENARRKSLVGKRLLFEKPDDPETSTVVMSAEEFYAETSHGMSMSQRLSSLGSRKKTSPFAEQLYIVAGLLAVGALIGAVIYLVYYLNY